MRSPHSTTPRVAINRTPTGFRVVCSEWGEVAERRWRQSADLTAGEHVKGHGAALGGRS